MNDFLDVADALWKSNTVGNHAQHFQRVSAAIGALQAVHSKAQLDLSNIETVFNTLEMARILRKFPQAEDMQIEEVIEALKYVIVTTLERTIKFPFESNRFASKRVDPPVPFTQFAGLVRHLVDTAHPKRTVAVLTFNYDMAADYALYLNGLGPDYAIETGGDGIPLLKLHGSMNWAICQQCRKVVPWHLHHFFQKFNYSMLFDEVRDVRLDIWSRFADFQHCEKSVRPLPFLVPPTWNKTDHHESIQVVWERAAKELTDAENIFVIGYSLPDTDAFFRTLYALGTVGGTPLKRIWVLNPDRSGNVEGRFRQLIGPGAAARFTYLPFAFGGAINAIRQEFPPRQ